MDDETLKRVEELEIRYAFQEALLRDLDDVMRAQSDQIDQLRSELRTLRDQLAQDGEAPNALEDEKPPHY